MCSTINILNKWMKRRRTTHRKMMQGLDLIDFYVLPHYLTAPFKRKLPGK